MGDWKLLLAAVAGICGLGLGPAAAEDAPFAALYTTDTMPAGEVEVEQWASWAFHKPHEEFRAFQGRSEVEYGISDDFLLGLYANYSASRIRPRDGRAPDGAEDGGHFDGVSVEAIYAIADASEAPLGIALYLEPSYGDGERAIEGKILLQKNFLDGRLIVAANLNLEYVWVRAKGALPTPARWTKQSAAEILVGASYRFVPRWFAGAEFVDEIAFEDQLGFGHARYEASTFFAGPTLHYAGDEWWMTLGALAQLPWANGANVEHGFVSGSERLRVTFRVGIEL